MRNTYSRGLEINSTDLLSNSNDKSTAKARQDIIDSINNMLSKIDAYNITKKAINEKLKDRKPIYVISFGKAAIPMAKAAEEKLNIINGVVITNKQCKNTGLKCIESSHPIISQKSIEAAEAVLNLIKQAKSSDTILFLISGGGSSLVEMPCISLKNLQKTNKILIKSNLTIDEINCIRKHLSKIKGGKMLRYTKAKIKAFIISDVIGDDISTIASGTTYYDNYTFRDAIKIVESHNLKNRLPKETIDFLNRQDKECETLKKEEFYKYSVENFIILSNVQAVYYVAEYLEQKGYSVILGPELVYNVEKAAEIALKAIHNAKSNTAIIFGGEVTIDVTGNGVGGRNQHFTLIMADKIENENVVFAAFATDGKDGNSPCAGAITDSRTIERAKKINLDIHEYIKNCDSFHFFKQLNDTIEIENTNTNLADIYIAIKYK